LGLCFTLIFPSSSITQTRDSDKVYRVAILPFLIHSQENLDYLREGIYDILLSRITVEGRIIVMERSMVERALYEERPVRLDESVAMKIGMKLRADYIVFGSLTKVGNYISLDARLISISEEKPPLSAYTQHKGIDDVMIKIGEFAQDIGYKILGRRPMAGRPTESKPSSIIQQRKDMGRGDPEGLGFKKSQNFDFEIKGLDIGDVDGDKKNEIVFMDDHNLYIFKYDGEKLNLFQKIESGYQNNFLTLDVADINRNGYAEIIVTSVAEDNLRSFILEYEEGRFRKITEKANWYFRVLHHPKEGPILMGQRMGSEGLYVGSIYKFVWKKNSFEKGPKMPFPRDTKIFGVTVGDFRTPGTYDTILLDDFDRLRIYSPDGKFSWRSKERLGGTNVYYDTIKKKYDGYRPQESPPYRVFIPARILIRDLDGDGIPELIVNKNEFFMGSLFGRSRIFDKGAIHNFIWTEDGLTNNWKTREIKGYLSDYQIKDVDNDGEEELVVSTIAPIEQDVPGLFAKKTKSNIYFFKIF
jgi:TolB-like protein